MATRRGGRKASQRRKNRVQQSQRRAQNARRAAIDAVIEQAAYIERLRVQESKRARAWMDQALDRIDPVLRGALDRIKSRGLAGRAERTKTIRDALARAGKALTVAVAAFRAELEQTMLDLARLDAEFIGRATFAGLPVDVSFRAPPVSQVRAMIRSPIDGQTLEQWSGNLSRAATNKVRQSVQRGLLRGSPTDDIAAEVRQVLNLSGRQAEALTRTALTHASAGARELFAQANSDLVVGVRWVSVMDSRVTHTCAALDGKVFAIGEGPRPPAHFACRSTVTMLTRSAEEVLTGKLRPVDEKYLADAGQRATRGATRPAADERSNTITQHRASTTLGSWLRTQPAATQDRVLGRTVGRMFRARAITIEQAVDVNWKPMTLDQIAQRWGIDVAKYR